MLIIAITNDGTGPDEASNYRYLVKVNDQVIDLGEVKGHDRKKGWTELVQRLLDQRPFDERWEKAMNEAIRKGVQGG